MRHPCLGRLGEQAHWHRPTLPRRQGLLRSEVAQSAMSGLAQFGDYSRRKQRLSASSTKCISFRHEVHWSLLIIAFYGQQSWFLPIFPIRDVASSDRQFACLARLAYPELTALGPIPAHPSSACRYLHSRRPEITGGSYLRPRYPP